MQRAKVAAEVILYLISPHGTLSLKGGGTTKGCCERLAKEKRVKLGDEILVIQLIQRSYNFAYGMTCVKVLTHTHSKHRDDHLLKKYIVYHGRLIVQFLRESG